MAMITLRVVDGSDRGREFSDLLTPVTIGREEGNTIQLNDERVSRYHVKIQDDHDRLVLTDLESTNGTKVNGEDIQLRILRYGDMITVGRSVLLFGSRDEIAERLARDREERHNTSGGIDGTVNPSDLQKHVRPSSLDFELNCNWNTSEDGQTMHVKEPPEIPDRLSPGQAAQLGEMLDYLHRRVRGLLGSVKADTKAERVMLDQVQWQNLVDIQARLAEYIRHVGEP